MNDLLIKKTTAFFQNTFQNAPEKIVLSPGRINIIGEHIDYNDGYVLPAAIDKIICFAFAKNNTKKSKIIAVSNCLISLLVSRVLIKQVCNFWHSRLMASKLMSRACRLRAKFSSLS